ncbi:hypothetical protein V9W64_03300 [Neisseria leonii]|uniref:Uncharacterized protein n=1 Tax=Neisseria leonii TaxID=2995413 RepID=A0A9X4IER5_9NEIS|nr:hypothetical protein [Neisseria sp. 51.81]MDD9328378.1 hypothetical protein [Neisseria sp. 51.81]
MLVNPEKAPPTTADTVIETPKSAVMWYSPEEYDGKEKVMNGAVMMAAVVFGLLIVGAWPLVSAVLLLLAAWFVWAVFRKEPETESNGWCRELEKEHGTSS